MEFCLEKCHHAKINSFYTILIPLGCNGIAKCFISASVATLLLKPLPVKKLAYIYKQNKIAAWNQYIAIVYRPKLINKPNCLYIRRRYEHTSPYFIQKKWMFFNI